MTRYLVTGCGDPDHGRTTYELPVRADHFLKVIPKRCKVLTRQPTKDDDGTCGNAIMLLGVEDRE